MKLAEICSNSRRVAVEASKLCFFGKAVSTLKLKLNYEHGKANLIQISIFKDSARLTGLTGRALDLRSTIQQFVGSNPTRQNLRNSLGQVVHTYVPLSPSNMTWYRPRGWEGNYRPG